MTFAKRLQCLAPNATSLSDKMIFKHKLDKDYSLKKNHKSNPKQRKYIVYAYCASNDLPLPEIPE